MSQQAESISVPIGKAILTVPAREAAQILLENFIRGGFNRFGTQTPPSIGKYWHGQGGVYAGLMRGINGSPDYHLIVPTHDSASTQEIAWGATGEDEPAAQHDSDGQENTRALLESDHPHPAAEWAAGLSIDGHDDFYLPARKELALCWANVQELFPKAWHWSSTQYSPLSAWLQYFDDGGQGYGHKSLEGRARAVRRVLAI